jgi:hypothetical protein
MFVLIHLIFFFQSIRTENIFLPSLIINNQSSSLYLCHVHQLNNSNEVFLQNYSIINGENTSYVHHLLLYECSIKDKLIYSGLCGKYNVRLMPKLVYRHCQTRIIIAWAKGGQLKYNYPINTGLKITSYTQFLLEIHFEPFIPYSHSIGIHLELYPKNKNPEYEIGVLTLGTLANSPLYLPPRLNSIRFPTYCFNDCLKNFLKNNLQINIFSILVHAHRRAIRIILKDNNFNRLIDQNPFEYHRQENIYFNKPYPKINSTNELSLICYYSTKNDYSKPIYGGYNSDNEMCQAFLYYYPKIPSFPLCLSLPIYNNNHNWINKQSLVIKNELESNINHLSMCGDNIYFNNTNQTMLQMKFYQRSMEDIKHYSNISIDFFSSFYPIIIFLFLISIIYCYLIIKKKTNTYILFLMVALCRIF